MRLQASPWQNGYVESFQRRFDHELGDLNRFESAGEMIEAIYRHIPYYHHNRIHTALKMPPAVYAAHMLSGTRLHELGT
ncbi:MAG: transposase [Chloroflexi bacterium]|nr:transposase [Chloroflexota bacterium]